MAASEAGTALVTGATEGIGRALAFTLARAGYRVGICARTARKVEELVRSLRAEGLTAAGTACDVASEVQVPAAVARLTGELGPVDVLVNNAGIAVLKPFAELSLAEWDAMIATNLRSLYLVTREVLPGMRSRKSGAVVNIASLAGRNGLVGGTGYSATKHAVLGFSRSLMLEVRKEDIRVMTVCPGSVDTALIHGQSGLNVNPERILQPQDVADVVLGALRLPARALVSELDVRPTNP